jgi:acetoin utilization deacetylase AcuC-like enzyme
MRMTSHPKPPRLSTEGVELAFWNTSRVLTLSAHFHDPKGGFYPLSGDVLSSGPTPPSPAASHALNIPIRIPGALSYVCRRTIIPLISAYQPSAVVIQCGVDGLAGDPIGGRLWGLGLKEMGSCLETVIQDSICHDRKVLLLGGGGYHTPNVARAWAYFTSIAVCNQSLTLSNVAQ